MSKELIESIINGDYVLANELFEESLSDISEKKLYEVKRMMQSEAFGGMTRAEAEKRIRARGMTPRKASDVLGDPRETKIDKSKPKPKSTMTGSDELGANLQTLRKQWKSASFGERKTALKKLPSLVKQYAGVSDSEKPEKPSTKSTPAAAPSVSDARAERTKQSWDRFRTNLAAKMDRNSAMEKKRKEFMKARPLAVAKKIGMAKAAKVGRDAIGGIGKGAIGALSDIGSQLEE